MKDKDLLKILEKVKETSELGGGFSSLDLEKGRERLMRNLGAEEDKKVISYGVGDYVQYMSWKISKTIFRPLAMGLAIFVLVFGGSSLTVNASIDSLPGDVLYPVKLASERVQLTFTSSKLERAKLHTDFASRRVSEAVNIQASNASEEDKEEQMQDVVFAFTEELEKAQAELTDLQESNPEEAAELALIIDKKTDEYMATVEPSDSTEEKESNTEEAVEEGVLEETLIIDDIAIVAEEAANQAVETMVDHLENNEEEITASALKETLKGDFAEINEIYTFSLGRLSSIEQVLEKIERSDEVGGQVNEASNALNSINADFHEAMATLAAGGYKTAHEDIELLKEEIAAAENILIDLEISISISGELGE
jgi:hypothetical protein